MPPAMRSKFKTIRRFFIRETYAPVKSANCFLHYGSPPAPPGVLKWAGSRPVIVSTAGRWKQPWMGPIKLPVSKIQKRFERQSTKSHGPKKSFTKITTGSNRKSPRTLKRAKNKKPSSASTAITVSKSRSMKPSIRPKSPKIWIAI